MSQWKRLDLHMQKKYIFFFVCILHYYAAMEVCKTSVYCSVVPPSEVSRNVFLSCEMWSRRHCAGRRDRRTEGTGMQYSRRNPSCLPQLRLRLLSAQWPGCGRQTPDGWVHIQEEDSHCGSGCTSGTWLPRGQPLTLWFYFWGRNI